MPTRNTVLTALLAASLALASGWPAATASAQQEPAVISGLKSEAATLFDLGMKRLRDLVQNAGLRLSSPADPRPRVGVYYEPQSQSIEIIFEFPMPSADRSVFTEPACLALHRRAVDETFLISRQATVLNMTFEEKVRRRLGLLFTHEQTTATAASIPMGQRLAELTYLTVSMIGPPNGGRMTCRRLVVRKQTRDIGDD